MTTSDCSSLSERTILRDFHQGWHFLDAEELVGRAMTNTEVEAYVEGLLGMRASPIRRGRKAADFWAAIRSGGRPTWVRNLLRRIWGCFEAESRMVKDRRATDPVGLGHITKSARKVLGALGVV